MDLRVRKIIILVSVVVILGSLISFLATGMYPYTRFRDSEIEQANAESGLADLFAETTESPAETPKVESVNAIGFLPSGPGLASVSVVTLSGPAVVAIAGVFWWGRRKGNAVAGGAETVSS